MKIEGGMVEFENWYIQFRQQWTEWFTGRYNWKTFTVAHIEYEDETCTANRSFVFFLLGVGFHIQWSTGRESPALDIAKERMAEIELHPECAVDLEEILNRPSDSACE